MHALHIILILGQKTYTTIIEFGYIYITVYRRERTAFFISFCAA